MPPFSLSASGGYEWYAVDLRLALGYPGQPPPRLSRPERAYHLCVRWLRRLFGKLRRTWAIEPVRADPDDVEAMGVMQWLPPDDTSGGS